MKEIDLRNSFLVLNADEQNTWRTNIQSVLLKYDQNKVHYSYLAKECRAEGICDSPFLDVGRYESVRIITYKGSYNLQTGYARRILKKNPTINKFYKKCDNEDLIFDNKCEIEYLNYDNVLAILKQNLNENIFLKVSYEFQSEKYSIICITNLLSRHFYRTF